MYLIDYQLKKRVIYLIAYIPIFPDIKKDQQEVFSLIFYNEVNN